MTTELWADNTSGEVILTAAPTATSLHVSTLSGTFPTPGGGEAFHIIVNFGGATAETAKVTANTAGVFTVAAPLAYEHIPGELVAAAITAEGLSSLGGGGGGGTSPVLVYSVDLTYATITNTTELEIPGYIPQKYDELIAGATYYMPTVPWNTGGAPEASLYIGSTATAPNGTIDNMNLAGAIDLSPSGSNTAYGVPDYGYYNFFVTKNADHAYLKFNGIGTPTAGNGKFRLTVIRPT